MIEKERRIETNERKQEKKKKKKRAKEIGEARARLTKKFTERVRVKG